MIPTVFMIGVSSPAFTMVYLGIVAARDLRSPEYPPRK
jgi:hypothetical protein